jgi:hypothetical protein
MNSTKRFVAMYISRHHTKDLYPTFLNSPYLGSPYWLRRPALKGGRRRLDPMQPSQSLPANQLLESFGSITRQGPLHDCEHRYLKIALQMELQ